MAYDPYKSLLANASREHLKRNADLNTHLVGNVFLPAIDSHHKKNPSVSTASFKHLKVIEQCIMAENQREERLAKCATITERRIMTKKFQMQRERERQLVQSLMLGNYPEREHEIKLLEKEVVDVTMPRQQLNQEIAALSARVATPDRVFRKADVTGGVPKAKPHAHKKFKLPECNGSPGKTCNARAQNAASVKLTAPLRGALLSPGETQIVANEPPTRKERSPLRSAKSDSSVRSPKTQVIMSSESPTTIAVGSEPATSPNRRVRSPYISMQRHQAKSATQLSSLSIKTAEKEAAKRLANAIGDDESEEISVAFEGVFSFSEAQRLAGAMGSDAQLLKEKCETILAEIATQTTPRLLEDAKQENSVAKAFSRLELPQEVPSLVAAFTQNATATTPRRPQSDRAQRATRQSFLESLASENKMLQERKRVIAEQADNDVNVGSETTHEHQTLAGDKVNSQADEEEDSIIGPKDALYLNEIPGVKEEYDSDFGDQDLVTEEDADEDLETDVAEILFDLVDMVVAAVAEEDKEKVIIQSPRTVSPRPRSSMGPTTKYVLRIQSLFRGYRARIAFRLALYEDALSCGVLGAMPGTTQGQSGWYLDPKRLMAYYFVIPEPDGEWEQKFTLRCSRLVLTPYEMRQEVLSKTPAGLLQLLQAPVERREEEE